MHGGLHLGHCGLVDTGGWVEDNTLRRGLYLGISLALQRYRLKHPIDRADVETHTSVQAGAKSVDEGDGADVQGRLVYLCRAGAVRLQALRNNPQEDTQHHIEHRPIALHKLSGAGVWARRRLAQREVAQAHVFEQLQRVGNAGHAMTTRRRTRASMC